MRTRNIIITDLETTGLDASIHEIIEIGALLVDIETLKVMHELSIKVLPTNIQTASFKALEVNGYNELAWRNAIHLLDAIELYSACAKDAIFCSHNVAFDWSFMQAAFRKTGVQDTIDYHRLDIFTMAYTSLKNSRLEKFSLNEIALRLGIDKEPTPHRAINGALVAYEIFKRLV